MRGIFMYNNITECLNSQEQKKILAILSEKKLIQANLSQHLIAALQQTDHSSEAIINRIQCCGNFISLSTDGKIIGANFCKHRLCPICQWRLSRKVYAQSRLMQIKAEEYEPGNKYVFLTLTLRNEKTIGVGIDKLQAGIHRLLATKQVKRSIRGFIKTVEITYKSDDKTWHPHIHMILAVPPNYYTDSDVYISHNQWMNMWRRAAKINYDPWVDIRTITDKDIQGAAIAEISKYAVKPIDLSEADDETSLYKDLINHTYKRRLRSYGGIYKQAAANIKIDIENPLDRNMQQDDDTINYIYDQGYKLYDARINGEIYKG